jgi:hypothetical protein
MFPCAKAVVENEEDGFARLGEEGQMRVGVE